MHQIRTASSTWSGDLLTGSGMITGVTSGSFAGLPVSWAARTEDHGGKTSPEELLAAAHAACFSMAFSNGLAKNGTVATRLDITCAVTFEKVEAGWKVIQPLLDVWKALPPRQFPNYAAGSQGPASSDRMLAADGAEWRKI